MLLETRADHRLTAEADILRATSDHERLQLLLHYAVLAPSGHNSQPWLFRLVDDAVEIYADREYSCPVADPNDRELTMSCGAALLNLRVAIRHFGFVDEVEEFPYPVGPDLFARVRLGPPAQPSAPDERLFAAIPRRRTYRLDLEDRGLPPGLLSELQEAAESEGAWLEPLTDDAARHAVADLVAEATRAQWRNKEYREELAAWVRPNLHDADDGIPGYSLGFGTLVSFASPILLRNLDLGSSESEKVRHNAMEAPALVALGTDADDEFAWLRAGQALGRVLLRACADSVFAAFFNQPIEVPRMRAYLRDVLGRTGYPQLMFRLGYGRELRPTPRRPLDESIFEIVRRQSPVSAG